MEKPIISVIVPIYKVEQYINKCIDSIINQTYKNLEIILVDDGSPDNCPQICDDYAKKDSRIKVIHKKNGGLSDARNSGIREATGEYIGFVDSDDYIDEEMYEYLYELIENNNADISICGFKKVYENGDVINSCIKENVCLNSINALKELALNSIIGNYVWNKLFKASLFNGVFFPVGENMEDIKTTYKTFENGNLVAIGNEMHYYYIQRQSSIMGMKSAKNNIQYIKNLWSRYEHFIDNEELNFYFYKGMLYAYLRLYVDDGAEILDYMKKEKTIENTLKEGKKRNFLNKLSLEDRVRIMLFKVNKRLYKRIMIIRRHIIKKLEV